jgi:hypothetical protein
MCRERPRPQRIVPPKGKPLDQVKPVGVASTSASGNLDSGWNFGSKSGQISVEIVISVAPIRANWCFAMSQLANRIDCDCDHQSAQRRVDESEEEILSSQNLRMKRWASSTSMRKGLLLTCYIGVGAILLLGRTAAASSPFPMAQNAVPQTASPWKHRALVEELQSLTKSNLERVGQLSANAGDLVLEIDKLKKMLDSTKPLYVEPIPALDGDCPDWVDALGGGTSPMEADTDSWIDGPSSTSPTPPGEGLTHPMYKYGLVRLFLSLHISLVNHFLALFIGPQTTHCRGAKHIQWNHVQRNTHAMMHAPGSIPRSGLSVGVVFLEITAFLICNPFFRQGVGERRSSQRERHESNRCGSTRKANSVQPPPSSKPA